MQKQVAQWRPSNTPLSQRWKRQQLHYQGLSARLQEVTARTPMRTYMQLAELHRDVRPVCWQCGNAGHFRRDCQQRLDNKVIYNKDWTKYHATGWKANMKRETLALTPSHSKHQYRCNDTLKADKYIWDKPCLVTIRNRMSVIITRPDTVAGQPQRKQSHVTQKASRETIPVACWWSWLWSGECYKSEWSSLRLWTSSFYLFIYFISH